MKIDVYMPREDSYMLEKEVLEHSKGSVLDMGTGSGIQAQAAASLKKVRKVLAVDKNSNAVKFCKDKLKSRKIKILKSDLFSKVPKQKFDTIIFNPPYLPKDKTKDMALDGGKKGHELLEKFLNQVNEYLDSKGVLLIIFSSLTNKDKIDQILRDNLFEKKFLTSKKFFHEELFVYKITKSGALRDLEKKNIKNVQYLASGKRGVVFTGKYKSKKVAIKIKHPESKAEHSIENEAHMLKLLNKHKIGPKFVLKGDNLLVYEFVSGEYIKDWLSTANKNAISKVFTDVLKQCHILDKMHVNKEEMHRPLKHVIIGKKIVMIDFERTHKTKSAKNVTQFLQFIRTNDHVLKRRGFNISKDLILDISKSYKNLHNIHAVIKGLGL